MSKLSSYTVKGLNEHPAYYLPALLNFHGVSVRQSWSRTRTATSRKTKTGRLTSSSPSITSAS